jgi:hypothetical protein
VGARYWTSGEALTAVLLRVSDGRTDGMPHPSKSSVDEEYGAGTFRSGPRAGFRFRVRVDW